MQKLQRRVFLLSRCKRAKSKQPDILVRERASVVQTSRVGRYCRQTTKTDLLEVKRCIRRVVRTSFERQGTFRKLQGLGRTVSDRKHPVNTLRLLYVRSACRGLYPSLSLRLSTWCLPIIATFRKIPPHPGRAAADWTPNARQTAFVSLQALATAAMVDGRPSTKKAS